MRSRHSQRVAGLLVALSATLAGACSNVLALDDLEKVVPSTRAAGAAKGADDADAQSTSPATGGHASGRGNPVPALATMNPSSALVGTPGLAFRLGGAGFVPGSVVQSDGHALPTTFVSPSELTSALSASDLAAARILTITVMNPAPGGGMSGEPKTFVVSTACDGDGVDVPLGPLGTETTRALEFSGAAPPPPLLAPGTCPTTLNTVGNRLRAPFRTFIVQNTSAATVTLSAWTACSSSSNDNEDALLAFYRRETAPVTDTERLACVGSVAEGAGAVGAFASAESNGARYCPGLTKSNGGGLRLASCERAVVYVQPGGTYGSAAPSPPYIRFRPE